MAAASKCSRTSDNGGWSFFCLPAQPDLQRDADRSGNRPPDRGGRHTILQQETCEYGGVVGMLLQRAIRLADVQENLGKFSVAETSERRVGRISPTIAAAFRRFDQEAGMGRSRPDIDNYLKSAMDALNGIVVADDSLIVKVTAEKKFGVDPKLVLLIEPAVAATSVFKYLDFRAAAARKAIAIYCDASLFEGEASSSHHREGSRQGFRLVGSHVPPPRVCRQRTAGHAPVRTAQRLSLGQTACVARRTHRANLGGMRNGLQNWKRRGG